MPDAVVYLRFDSCAAADTDPPARRCWLGNQPEPLVLPGTPLKYTNRLENYNFGDTVCPGSSDPFYIVTYYIK